jgi:hypothetical protein
MLPEIDLERVRRWAATRVSPQLQDKARVEVDVKDRAITIFQCHPPWKPEFGPDWTRVPVARLRYTRKRNDWTLYWADRNSEFHVYRQLVPSHRIDHLIQEIDKDPTGIFWG